LIPWHRGFFAALLAAVALTAPAQASVPHTVAPGETLWSIAAASNFTTRALAAANGLPENAQVVVGSTIQIPSEAEAAAALAGMAPPAVPTAPANAGTAAPPPSGAYTVKPGDTLSAIAAQSGVSMGKVAFINGLDPDAPLLIGTVLKLPPASPLAGEAPAATPVAGPAAPGMPQGTTPVVPDAAPYPTPGSVTSEQIGSVAAAHGVSPSLAAAVAWQESGFNNGMVSSANARGVMQVLPGTWTWVEENLAHGTLDPSSPLENVHAGVMYLGQLVKEMGGDEGLAAAAYYQGMGSVRKLGLLPSTQRYVADVMALRSRFGGP
jgi:soluble lytic murein transglycosylase-like protein